MAGFGAGFAKAISGSLDSAGKMFQEEQLRTREYERARADKRADVADEREYQSGIRLEERAYQEGREASRQALQDEANPDRISVDGGKYYYTNRAGQRVEKSADDPLVKAYIRFQADEQYRRNEQGLTLEQKRAGIRASNAQTNASNAQARSNSGKLPPEVYARMKHDLAPVSARYENMDSKLRDMINRGQRENNPELVKEAQEMRRALLTSQDALSAQYVASGFQADPLELFKPRAQELSVKFPKAWGGFVAMNNDDWSARKAREAGDKKKRAAALSN